MRTREPIAIQARVPIVIVVAILASQPLAGADTRIMAARVAAQLEAQELQAFAVEDPQDPGRFVSALYIGGHILAISAVHPSPAFVRREIAGGNFRQVYSILSSTAQREGRLFVEDFGQPGLRLTGDPTGSADITWRDSTRQTVFDGHWRTQEFSEAEYHRRFASDEVEYAEMLQLLDTALQRRSGARNIHRAAQR